MSKLDRVHSTISFNDINNKNIKWYNTSNSKLSANKETNEKFKIIQKNI